ncbi:YceI family protein [Ornithinimicrobium humiphilum]|uniref:Polyisoprenoid-binding protein YceI n=1 Tax=Ornithinimicrobium humiphilum TaxID=125288 RepID=A0A543K7Q0_9MICO|nr:YceI family protein [Ornithinimicrobium humiphilum]TQM91090.1 polyisoprenoid-binding protein YceI [Ornithinimicrobium humiphilum]
MTDAQTTTATVRDLAGTYTIDPAHSRLGFSARHAMVTKVRGAFNEVSGTATTGPDLEGASVEVTIQAASIDTRQADRDGHLRSADFFDVETYPTLTFRSTEVTAADDTTLRVTGDLTVKDVTRPVSFDLEFLGSAQDPFGNVRVGFEGSTEISRKDFGLTWNAALETGGFLVSDKVVLEFEISAIKAA